MLNIGIYKIKNLQTNKVYIGSSNDLEKRKKQHFSELREKRHINKELQKDFSLYGENNFRFQVVEYTWRNNRLEREQAWIDKCKRDGIVLYNTATPHKNTKTIADTVKGILRKIKQGILEALM